MSEDQSTVIAFLSAAESYGETAAVSRIDTHAAIVFLVGARAFKMKKAVKFPFLDFSTLALREAAVKREIAINRRYAPEIYLGALAVTRRADGVLALGGGLGFAGDGPPVEWLTVMNRFDEAATLDHLCSEGPLRPGVVADLAGAIARMQARAEWREFEPWIADLADYIEQNHTAFLADPALFPLEAAHRLRQVAQASHARIRDLLVERGRLGCIRLLHGDLHAGNVATIDGRPVPFDAIEFDDAIATGDLLYDSGFLIMDLVGRGQTAAANVLLWRLIIETARAAAFAAPEIDRASLLETVLKREAEGLAALPLFLMMRAAIRAKVTAAKLPYIEPHAARQGRAEARHYFQMAVRELEPLTPRLIAIGGLSGAGKSTLAANLAPLVGRAPGALHLRTDVLRKLLFGVGEFDRLGPEAYEPEVSPKIYRLMRETTRAALAAGWPVIVDAVASKPQERTAFADLAKADEIPFTGLWLEAASDTLEARVSSRERDASDADARVIAVQAGYDTGPMDWSVIDAGGAPEVTLAQARAVIGV
ncbi:MAG: AAA family ATPase [Ancalomicrobiaceae bacterium]|nr:AAA family ATPase [Ancalomicrobiaceae bacterium]